MNFPYETFRVPGEKALEKLAELQQKGQAWPVILGDADAFERMTETFGMDAGTPLEQALLAAGAVDPAIWFADRVASNSEYFDIEDGDWPEGEVVPNNHLSAHCDVLTGKPHKEVVIALIPAAASWMVPCYLRIGGWNECPNAEEHSALFKYWEEKYGAKVACIADDVIEFEVARPPTNRADALLLAREQYVYCADIVQQGAETVEALASVLLNGRVWYFWWD
jgi:hypothetical protein